MTSAFLEIAFTFPQSKVPGKEMMACGHISTEKKRND